MTDDQNRRGTEETNELLKNMLIIQLGLAGVPQQKIRDIVGGDIRKVNKIVKLLKTKER